jgi:hypothetical protein
MRSKEIRTYKDILAKVDPAQAFFSSLKKLPELPDEPRHKLSADFDRVIVKAASILLVVTHFPRQPMKYEIHMVKKPPAAPQQNEHRQIVREWHLTIEHTEYERGILLIDDDGHRLVELDDLGMADVLAHNEEELGDLFTRYHLSGLNDRWFAPEFDGARPVYIHERVAHWEMTLDEAHIQGVIQAYGLTGEAVRIFREQGILPPDHILPKHR